MRRCPGRRQDAAASATGSPADTLTGGTRRANARFYPLAMAALIDPEAFDDDWTTRFIQEIEDWVRERYLREEVTTGVVAPTAVANTSLGSPSP